MKHFSHTDLIPKDVIQLQAITSWIMECHGMNFAIHFCSGFLLIKRHSLKLCWVFCYFLQIQNKLPLHLKSYQKWHLPIVLVSSSATSCIDKRIEMNHYACQCTLKVTHQFQILLQWEKASTVIMKRLHQSKYCQISTEPNCGIICFMMTELFWHQNSHVSKFACSHNYPFFV